MAQIAELKSLRWERIPCFVCHEKSILRNKQDRCQLMISFLLLGIALVLAFTTVVITQKHYKTVVALKEIIADMEQNHKYQFQQFQGEHDKEEALRAAEDGEP